MKVLIIATGYPSSQDSRWGCFERDQAIALKNSGHDVSILVLDAGINRHGLKHGISITHTDAFDVYVGHWFPTKILKIFGDRFRDRVTCYLLNRVYQRLVKDFGVPDIMYAHYQWNIYFSLYLKEKYGIPLVGLEHWSVLMREQLPVVIERRGRKAYTQVDKLLAVSKALSDSLGRKFGVDAEVVNNMLGPEFLGYTHEAKRVAEGVHFIAIGSLLPIKRYDLLIRAFAESGLSNKGCSLSIVGEGSERKLLEEIVEEYHIQDSVHLLGRRGKEEIVQALRESDVFVVSSRSETFSVVCIEAMSQGLPCIATRCGGPEEIVTEKDGVLIDPEDQEGMKRALIYMFDNHSQFDRDDISCRCLNRFSPEVIARQLTDIFNGIISNRSDS